MKREVLEAFWKRAGLDPAGSPEVAAIAKTARVPRKLVTPYLECAFRSAQSRIGLDAKTAFALDNSIVQIMRLIWCTR